MPDDKCQQDTLFARENLKKAIVEYTDLFNKMKRLSTVLPSCTLNELTTLSQEIATQEEVCKEVSINTLEMGSPKTTVPGNSQLYNDLFTIMQQVQQLNDKLRHSLQAQLSLLKTEMKGIKQSKPALAGYAKTLKPAKANGLKRIC